MAQAFSAIAIAIGVRVAYGQLKATREAVARKRRAELAEELMVIVSQVEDSFKNMRNPFDSIPQEKLGDKEFIYKKRFERITAADDLFLKLREYQVRCDAVFSSEELRPLVAEVFNARSEIAMAIENLISNETIRAQGVPEDSEAHRRVLYGTWSDKDKFGTKLLASLNAIREITRNHASKN